MNIQNLLVGLNSVILIFLVVNVFKPFFGSYAAKKGENLATKEDIAQLTKIAEGIKAKISDEVWDRQKQWEMRRDAVLDVVRAIGKLNQALISLNSEDVTYEYCRRNPEYKDQQDKTFVSREAAIENYGSCRSEFEDTRFVADLTAGKELRIALFEYFKVIVIGEALVLTSSVVPMNRDEFFNSQSMRDQKINAVYEAARKELNIKSEDFIVAEN
jgi:hypothetical protein